MRKSLLGIIALLLLVGYGIYDYKRSDANAALPETSVKGQGTVGVKKGETAPDFQTVNMDGASVRLSDYRGKKVLVNFWATWCPPCRVEMPHMKNIYEDYKDEVVILGVNLTTTETGKEDVRAFIDNYELTFPVVLDEQGEIMQTYRVVSYPTTYAIDRKGVITEKFRGAIDYKMMKQVLGRME